MIPQMSAIDPTGLLKTYNQYLNLFSVLTLATLSALPDKDLQILKTDVFWVVNSIMLFISVHYILPEDPGMTLMFVAFFFNIFLTRLQSDASFQASRLSKTRTNETSTQEV